MILTKAWISGRMMGRKMVTLRLAQMKDENTEESDCLAQECNQSGRMFVEVTFEDHQSDWTVRSPKMGQQETILSVLLMLTCWVGGGSGCCERLGVLVPVMRVPLEGSQQKKEKKMSEKWSPVPTLTATEKPGTSPENSEFLPLDDCTERLEVSSDSRDQL